MKREILIAALLITTAIGCSRKIGKEPPPEPATRQGEVAHRCLHPGDPGYDVNNGAPECNPDRAPSGVPAATTQPQPATPP